MFFFWRRGGGKKRRLSNRKKNTAKSTCECKRALPQKATVFCLRGRAFVFVFKKRPHQYLPGYSGSELNRGNQRRRSMFVVTGLGQRSSVFECLISKYFSPLSERKLCTTISGMFLVAGPGHKPHSYVVIQLSASIVGKRRQCIMVRLLKDALFSNVMSSFCCTGEIPKSVQIYMWRRGHQKTSMNE